MRKIKPGITMTTRAKCPCCDEDMDSTFAEFDGDRFIGWFCANNCIGGSAMDRALRCAQRCRSCRKKMRAKVIDKNDEQVMGYYCDCGSD